MHNIEFNQDIEMEMMDDEYRFRAFLRENNLYDRGARQAFKSESKD